MTRIPSSRFSSIWFDAMSACETRSTLIPEPAPDVPLLVIMLPAIRAVEERLTRMNQRPVVVLMDSPLPGRVYDDRTQAAGGTNADDVSDALRELPLLTHKENTNARWHREEQVRQQNPDLVISHLSSLLDMRAANGQAALEDELFDVAQLRLTTLMGYLGAANPRTKFLVYSRGRIWQTAEAEASWARDAVARYPILKERVFTLKVPGSDAATFRNPDTADLLRRQVKQILSLP